MQEAFRELNSIRHLISRGVYKTIKGQILAGNIPGAMTGIKRIKEKEKSRV